MSEESRAALAYRGIQETCGGDGHTLFRVEAMQAKLDRLNIPVKLEGFTIDQAFADSLKRGGGYGEVGARVIGGASIVSALAAWAGVDTSRSLEYMGRGTSHRAAVQCVADAARQDDMVRKSIGEDTHEAIDPERGNA